MSMTRSKMRTVFDCADCSNSDAEWASVNRGVIVCNECCIVHRNMGREVSQIKSIQKSQWSPSELQMVIDLYSSGSNSIWEYTLVNSGSGSLTSSLTHSMRSSLRKKPIAKDALYPTKNDFIKSKYSKLAFVKKPGSKQEGDCDVSEELHSSVRSSSLKTSLRLLIAGADPNYLHPEKNNTPLHVAAKSGQLAQMELLFAYGADPLTTDLSGKTALDYARSASHNDIVERLIEFQFEVTDRLSHFLCGRKPDHREGQHYLIPQVADSIEPSEELKSAKHKLQGLTNKQFEELAKDVYDEVDRRELDEIWLQLRSQSTNSPLRDNILVPFLPVNPMFSSTRNQGRQKLARYSAKSFTALLIDVLLEAKRRQLHSPRALDSGKLRITNSRIEWCLQNMSDDDTDPLYDSVASEEERDYDEVEAEPRKSIYKSEKNFNDSHNVDQYQSLQKRLTKSDSILQELLASNEDMRKEIASLKNMVNNLVNENAQLRTVVMARPIHENTFTSNTGPPFPAHHHHHHLHQLHQTPPAILPRSPNKIAAPRPQSMYDKPPLVPDKPAPPPIPSSPHRMPQPSPHHQAQPIITSTPTHSPQHTLHTTNMVKMQQESYSSHSSSEYGVLSPKSNRVPPSFPTKEEVFRKTEQITKGIQELLKVSLEGRQEVFIQCAENIRQAVSTMLTLFPEKPANGKLAQKEDQLFNIIECLKSNTSRLMSECKGSSQSSENNQKVEKVIDSAYDIARAAKQLIMIMSDF